MTTADDAIKRVEEARLDHRGEWALRYARLDTAVRDLIAALSTPPADDVREALMSVHYCPEHGDLLAPLDGRDTRSIRCVEAHTIEQILGSVRPRGTVTEAAFEWEYVPGEIWTDRLGGTHVAVQNGVIAPDYVSAYIAKGGDVLRRKVGPWETVTGVQS